jgi:hypothetical protein
MHPNCSKPSSKPTIKHHNLSETVKADTSPVHSCCATAAMLACVKLNIQMHMGLCASLVNWCERLICLWPSTNASCSKVNQQRNLMHRRAAHGRQLPYTFGPTTLCSTSGWPQKSCSFLQHVNCTWIARMLAYKCRDIPRPQSSQKTCARAFVILFSSSTCRLLLSMQSFPMQTNHTPPPQTARFCHDKLAESAAIKTL